MNDILHALGIQWSALLAQAVNFGILIFLLARFVYKPVLKVIDDRRKAIADSMQQVKDIEKQKERIDQERAVILRKADEEGGELLARAKTEAEAIRTEIESAAKAQAKQILAKGMEKLEVERARLVRDVQDKLAHAIVKSAETILRREFSKEDQQSFEEELKKNIPAMIA